MRLVIVLIMVSFLLGSCELNRREETLKEKEERLLRKEQELVIKEKTLALKEEELARRERYLDSSVIDTSLKYHPVLPGLWNVKMQCTETTCDGSAVGDTKLETWQFSFDSGFHLIAKVVSGNNIARVYTGSYNGNELAMVHDVAPSSTAPATHLSVRLQFTGPANLEGIREIVRGNECKITYSMQLTKQ